MTGKAAGFLGIPDRGRIVEGAWADLSIFDPDSFVSMASYKDPRSHARGMHAVFVNGVQVWAEGRPTGATSGRALRGVSPEAS